MDTCGRSHRWHGWALGLAGLIVVAGLVAIGYGVSWTGFSGYPQPPNYQPAKTLWDWLQLLVIPLALTVGGTLFNHALQRRAQALADEERRERALQTYLARMSDLAMNRDPTMAAPDSRTQWSDIGRANTLTVLRRLGGDGERKGAVLRFLHDAGLIHTDDPRISLDQANLRGAELAGANLSGADLSGADLSGADLRGMDLRGTDLRRVSGLSAGEIKQTTDWEHALYDEDVRGQLGLPVHPAAAAPVPPSAANPAAGGFDPPPSSSPSR